MEATPSFPRSVGRYRVFWKASHARWDAIGSSGKLPTLGGMLSGLLESFPRSVGRYRGFWKASHARWDAIGSSGQAGAQDDSYG